MSSDDNGAEHGVKHHKVTMLTVVFDHETNLVALGMKDVHLALAGMMLHEATVQIDTMRRQAAALELQQRVQTAREEQELRNALAGGRGRG